MAQAVAALYAVPQAWIELCTPCGHDLTLRISCSQDGLVRDEAVRTLYGDNSTWTDPLTSARGLESIVANYRSLPTVAASAVVEVQHATYTVNEGKDAVLR